VSLPEQLLLSDLLSRRVRCDRGMDHGTGQLGWMHPPVHRLLGWASRPSALAQRRCVWRLDQLRGLTEAEALVQGDPAETDPATLERLPTLLGAVLLSGRGQPLGRLADAAVELGSGRIRHYLVARSDPRLPGGSRWRLSPDRIVDQRPGEVSTALEGLDDLPLAHASLRETLLRRSRRWRDQWDEETSRLRDQWQQASGQFEQRLEGWLEEPPWEESAPSRPEQRRDQEIWPEDDEDEEPWPDAVPQRRRPWPRDAQAEPPLPSRSASGPHAGDGDPDRRDDAPEAWGEESADQAQPWPDTDAAAARRSSRRRGPVAEEPDDPWV